MGKTAEYPAKIFAQALDYLIFTRGGGGKKKEDEQCSASFFMVEKNPSFSSTDICK